MEDNFSEAYIQKIFEIQKKQQERPLSQEELKQVALDMGMTEEDWENLQRTYHDHLDRGEGFLRYGNLEDAVKEIEQAVAINPHRVKGLSMLASVYQNRWQQNGKIADALKALSLSEKIITIDATHDNSLRMISELKQYPEVRKQLSRRDETHEEITTQASNTRLYALIAAGVGALLILFFVLRGVMGLFSSEGQTKTQSYENSIPLNDNNSSNDNTTTNSSNTTTEIKTNPVSALDYFNNATAKEQAEDFGGALEDYNKAIELNPNYTDAYYGRGFAQYKLQYYQAAIADFSKVIALDKNYVNVFFNRGLAKYNLKDNEGALKDFDQAIAQNPSNADAFLNRGNAHYGLGDTKNACLDWNKAVDLGNTSANENISQSCN